MLESVERELASGDAASREQRRARILAQLPEPIGPPAEFVAVVSREWQALTTPWQPPEVSTSVQLVGSPQELRETVRYLWLGPPEACEATPQGSYLDLWITSPCCDTPIITGGACLMHMRFAEPAPASVA